MGATEKLHQPGRSAIGERHTAPAPEAFMYSRELGIVGRAVRNKDECLDRSGLTVRVSFEEDGVSAVGGRPLHDHYLFGRTAVRQITGHAHQSFYGDFILAEPLHPGCNARCLRRSHNGARLSLTDSDGRSGTSLAAMSFAEFEPLAQQLDHTYPLSHGVALESFLEVRRHLEVKRLKLDGCG